MKSEEPVIERGVLIGQTEGMAEPISFFLGQCQSASYYQEIDEFLVASVQNVDFILILQHWPDQYAAQQIESLIDRYPLSRIICCYGPWCQSAARTRADWPLVWRVSDNQFALRFAGEIQNIQRGVSPLEKTAGYDEIFEYESYMEMFPDISHTA